MNVFFELDDNRRRLVIDQTAVRIGLPEQAVEKDLWVAPEGPTSVRLAPWVRGPGTVWRQIAGASLSPGLVFHGGLPT